MFTYVFHDWWLFSSSGTEMGQKICIGPVSMIMRMLTHKIGDLPSFFDKIDESQGAIGDTTLKQNILKSQ